MSIPDFTDSEFQLVNQILFERYTRLVPLQAADVELQLDPASETLTTCPSLYWSELGAEFVVSKLADRRLRDQRAADPGRPSWHTRRCLAEGRRKTAADHGRGLPRPGHHMTLEKARQLLATQVGFGGGYNRNGARRIVADIAKEHGQAAADALIREFRLDQLFGLTTGGSP